MSLGTMEQRTEGIKRQADELIEQAYQRGFKAGQVDNQTFHESICEKCKNGLINQGRNEAWEAAKKLVSAGYKECNEILGDGVLAIETIDEIFLRCTASDAIEKLRKYEEQKKQEEESQEFNSCDECIHSNDSEEKCIERRCVHAIKARDCFKKRLDL